MSFSIAFKVTPSRTVKDTFDTADDIVNKEFAVKSGGELLEAALEIANDMVVNVVAPDETAHVSISGHWNGGFEPNPGWAANALTISVGQIYNPAKE